MKKYAKTIALTLLIIASMFTAVSTVYAYPPNNCFYGYVIDNDGNGIPGATVSAADYSATTDSSGFYNIYVPEQLCTLVIASKTGYFTQQKKAATITQPARVDFQLTEDTVTWVTMLAMFPNTAFAYIKHTSYSTHTVTVKAYAAGSGETRIREEEIETGIDAPGYPISMKRKATASGRYDANGCILDLFLKGFDFFEFCNFYETEYVDPNNVVGEVWGVLPGQTIERTYNLHGSTTNQGGLKTTVSFEVLGTVGVEVELETTMAITSTSGDNVYWRIRNPTLDYRYYFKVYMEDNIIPHIWFTGSEYMGQPPGGPGGGGECPFIFTWNGSSYVLDNNILPTSQLGNGSDVEDFYAPEQALVPKNGKYSLIISEFQSDHSYLDQFRLLAVDHEYDTKVAVTPDGDILTYKNPSPPITAIDCNGTDRLNQIRYVDGNLSDPATYFQGNKDTYLELNFGQIHSNNAKLIVRNDMLCMVKCIWVQVLNVSGQWQTVAVIASRAYWAVEGVDLSPYVVEGNDLMVRLVWTQPHKLDYVGLDTTKRDDYDIHYATMVLAFHSTQGEVKALLQENDNIYAELVPGQQILLEFTLPNNAKEARTYILYTEGNYYAIA